MSYKGGPILPMPVHSEKVSSDGNLHSVNLRKDESGQFRYAFGSLNYFFKCYGIHVYDEPSTPWCSCMNPRFCRFWKLIFFTTIFILYYSQQIYFANIVHVRSDLAVDLAYILETFFKVSHLYLLFLAYWSLFFRQNKLRKICVCLNDMTSITIGHDSPLFVSTRKRNITMTAIIYITCLIICIYYYMYSCYGVTGDTCYLTCHQKFTETDPDFLKAYIAQAHQDCNRMIIINIFITIGHLISIPFQCHVILFFLQLCYMLAISFDSMKRKHGLHRFPNNLYSYKAGRYIEYHSIHSKVVTLLNGIFSQLIITWNGLECLVVIFAIRQMHLHKTNPNITWESLILIGFNVFLFAIKSIIPAKANLQVIESLRGLTVIAKSKQNEKISNAIQVYEPTAMSTNRHAFRVETKIKLYIENVLTEVPMITGFGMYTISGELLLEAFAQILTYVIVLYGVPT